MRIPNHPNIRATHYTAFSTIHIKAWAMSVFVGRQLASGALETAHAAYSSEDATSEEEAAEEAMRKAYEDWPKGRGWTYSVHVKPVLIEFDLEC